jgi:hypothetical protein
MQMEPSALYISAPGVNSRSFSSNSSITTVYAKMPDLGTVVSALSGSETLAEDHYASHYSITSQQPPQAQYDVIYKTTPTAATDGDGYAQGSIETLRGKARAKIDGGYAQGPMETLRVKAHDKDTEKSKMQQRATDYATLSLVN